MTGCNFLWILCISIGYLSAALAQKDENINVNTTNGDVPPCYLKALDPLLYRRVKDMVDLNVKLIKYELSFPNLTVNPLTINNSWSYNPDKWVRVSQQHGQTLLSLSFNYGLLSLATLTFGTETLMIEVEDIPSGCMAKLNESSKIQEVMFLMMRDFKDIEPTKPEVDQVTLIEDERVCHELLKSHNGWAKFTDHCYQIDRITQELVCVDDIVNIWLTILFTMVVAVKFSVLFFGPLMLMSSVERLSKDTTPFIVKLKTPLVKTIYLCGADSPKVKFKRVLDLRHVKRFLRFKKAIDDFPVGEPVKIKLTEYHILVNYGKLLIENKVPVGITHSIIRNIFQCKIKEIGPFKVCCHTNMCRSMNTEARCMWISLWKMVARILVLFLIPTPFYLRLLVYYYYEYDEIVGREAMLSRLGLHKIYDGSLMYYLGPTHPVFISIYVIYFVTAFVLGILPKERKAIFLRILVGAFRDLKTCHWIRVVEILVSNAIWPFMRFGILGCLIAPIYWPIVLPLTLIISVFYFLPSIYLTMRMLLNTGEVFGNVKTKMQKGDYRVTKRNKDESLGLFEADQFVKKVKGENGTAEEFEDTTKYRKRVSKRIKIQRFLFHIFAAILSIVMMYAVLLILSECVGFAVEMAVFTMMGVIVNAGAILKFTILLIMTVLYSYDCYNNVGKKYLKLNKALFGEVKGRINDLGDVTSLPSSLQENRAFKSQELDVQGEHESPDDVAERPPLNLLINDLVLFVDSEDMPRIPHQLFHEVCEINIAGAPGPVYRSLIEATKEFLQIVMFLVFVFIIVMSFGAVYKVSTTNQMLATLAGGFLPFLMRTFMAPSKPDIELGTVSFKSKLDEIIQNFFQNWPMYDFPMEKWTEEDEKAAQEKDKDKDEEDTELFDRCVQTGQEDKAIQTQAMNGLPKLKLQISENSNNNAATDNVANSNNNAGSSNSNSTDKKGGIPLTPLDMELKKIDYEKEQAVTDEEVDIVIYLPVEKHEGWLREVV